MAEVTNDELIRQMVGREIKGLYSRRRCLPALKCCGWKACRGGSPA